VALNGYQAMKVREFGGLCTYTDATNIPHFMSPDCQDVEFLPGLVKTRPGTFSVFSALPGNPTVNYLKTFVTPALAQRMLALDSLGNLYKENPIGTLQFIQQVLAGTYGNSVSLFGREYLASSDGQFGLDIPRAYDDTNLDRVSQVGPGIAPSVQDEAGALALKASPNGLVPINVNTIATASETGNIVTITRVTPNPSPDLLVSKPGDSVVVAGVGVGAYNGTWKILSIGVDFNSFTYYNPTSGLASSGGGTASTAIYNVVPIPALSFPAPVGTLPTVTIAGAGIAGYNGTWSMRLAPGGANLSFQIIIPGQYALAASGNGTVTINGNVVAGIHQISVVFVTRNGYITAPAPAASWTAAGGKRAFVTNILTGPPNVVARILLFTASGGASFFYQDIAQLYTGNFIIQDNTTTTTTVDFSDTTLLNGVNADNLFPLIELGECSGVTEYSSRLFWWGERNKIQNFNNLTFDGGWTGNRTVPAGWTRDSANGAGGNSALDQGIAAYFGDAYTIISNGPGTNQGKMTQSAANDSLGNTILSPNTDYSVRVRLKKSPGTTSGNFTINLQSILGGFTTAGLVVPASSMSSSDYIEFTGNLTAPLSSIPSDLNLQIFGTPIPAGFSFTVDCIEIFPTNSPYNQTIVRSSRIEDPDSYDGVNGFLNVAPENGQAVRAGAVIRNNLYFVKERSLYVTQDDGTNEPASWSIQEISSSVGTPSVRGVGLGDEWLVIANQKGLWYFTGGLISEDYKLSKEIQATWDSINWTYGHLVDVKVDKKRKRIYVAAPFGSSTTPNKILTLDYVQGFGQPESQEGVGRKWSPWAYRVNSMNLILRPDGTEQLFLGNGAGTGKIYQPDTTGTIYNDDGAPIIAYWQSGYFQDTVRLNFGYITSNVVGSGILNINLFSGDQGWQKQVRGWLLNSLGFHNMERQIQQQRERMSIRFGASALNSFFSMQGLTMFVQESAWAPVRGINA